MSTSKSIFFSESIDTISSPSLMERGRHCLTVHAAISNSSTFIQETTFWIWGVAMVRLPSLLAFLVRLLLIYTFPNRCSRRTHPLMRWYVHWRTGIDIVARPEDTLHPDYSKLHLNEQSYLSLYVALRRAGFHQVRVWFDSPAPTGRLSIIKRSLLYNVLFGGNLTAVGIK